MPRLANYKINAEITRLQDFENYNKSIVGFSSEQSYTVLHWGTRVLVYNKVENRITYLLDTHISQTTSSLVGRIVRSLPRGAVLAFIDGLDGKDKQRRLARMANIC